MRRVSIAAVTALTIVMCMQIAADAHKIWRPQALGIFAAPLSAAHSPAKAEGVMQVNSKAISSGGEFPKRNTCDGGDVSPQLAWSDAPAGAQCFALILDDPDAPSGTFTHWLLWDLPASTHELAENLPKTAQLSSGGAQGRNDFGKTGYGGPCPPPGKPHRYFFRVYALDARLGVKPGAGRGELERAMKGHVLAQGELMGRYGR